MSVESGIVVAATVDCELESAWDAMTSVHDADGPFTHCKPLDGSVRFRIG